MNRLPIQKRAQILGMLCEGMSLRATSRLADVSINTVTKLLVDVGTGCAEYQDKTLRNLPCKRVQVDEIWSFVGKKEGNVPKEEKGYGVGDVWTWTALCADTKLMCSWMVGRRNAKAAARFMADLAERVKDRIQISSDGLKTYAPAISYAFGHEIDYGILVKVYGDDEEQKGPRRYSPPPVIDVKREKVMGV